MRILQVAIASLFPLVMPGAGAAGSFNHDYDINYERYVLNGLTLGADRREDLLIVEEFEFEFALEYLVSTDLYLFFTGALIDETDTIESAGIEESLSGLELREFGVGYYFGDSVDSLFRVGRTEFVSASEWWIWWDEELDTIRLDSAYRDFETLIALAENLVPENTAEDYIDPEIDNLRRILFSHAWEPAPGNALILYLLNQENRSDPYSIGDVVDYDRLLEVDEDLTWAGLSFIGGHRFENAGEFSLEAHVARVVGDETIYEFGDPENGFAELEERTERDVDGSGYGFLLGWTPPVLDKVSLYLGNARGAGDPDPEDSTDRSYRSTGLEGDNESFGELYQPELSNIDIDIAGVAWRINDETELALLGYRYRQVELAEEMRDVSIQIDPTGESRDLGREIDLVLTIETDNGLELALIAAEFYAGRAYGDFSGETATFFKFEIDYEF